jgi:hypothetical protein
MNYTDLILNAYSSIIIKNNEGTYFLLIPLYNESMNNCLYVKLDKLNKDNLSLLINQLTNTDNSEKLNLLISGVDEFKPIESYFVSQSLIWDIIYNIEDTEEEVDDNPPLDIEEAETETTEVINSSEETGEEEQTSETEPTEETESEIIDPSEETESEEESISLEDIMLPDYICKDANGYHINDYWTPVSNNEYIQNNLEYFIFKNKIKDYVFTEEELLSLNSTFMQLIQRYSTFDDYNVGTNAIYKAVIDYYANGQYDAATILMNTILNATINTTTVSTCGCATQSSCATSISSGNTGINTGTEIIPTDTATCIDKYKAAMYQWLIQMLGDTNFYCCWMFTNNDELDESNPNELLLDLLIQLLEEFLSLGLDLTNLGNSSSSYCNCGHNRKYNGYKYSDCGDGLNDAYNNGLTACSNYNIIANYIKVLKWVRSNEIEENKNKIYIYGKQFAEIFPQLNF